MNRPFQRTGSSGLAAEMNYLGARQIPFLFAVSYDREQGFVLPLHEVPPSVLYDINGITNSNRKKDHGGGSILSRNPVPEAEYRRAFETIIREIREGNTYVANLTFPTEITLDLSLEDIFHRARAPFKLLCSDHFTTFSPERFVRIRNHRIETFPMKGTIDASLPDARQTILASEKEMAEHVMIVDLLRNDLSIVAKEVRVDRFRYIDRICAGATPLLQVSSCISGRMENDWHTEVGSILMKMLPAGSITGAPKKNTVEIIEEAERDSRGFYTGVCGCFTGNALDSAVMIRFIEKKGDRFLFRSGGGITIDSSPALEYEEMLRKVYLPF